MGTVGLAWVARFGIVKARIGQGMKMPKVGEQVEKGAKRLTPPQQKFLDNYIHKDMTQTGAARAAGYKNPNV